MSEFPAFSEKHSHHALETEPSGSPRLDATYFQYFFTNPELIAPSFYIEVLVELPNRNLISIRRRHVRESELAFAIAHKAINDALDYDEKRFVSASHESLCPPGSVPEMAIEVPTETLENGARVWVRIIS
jgi:hypothetical protein